MNTPKQILKKTLATVFFCGCASFVLGGTPPFFPTDITLNSKGEILIVEKGTNRISFFSPDGKTLLRSIPVEETPTGILLDANKAYVTTSAATGHLQILSLESGQKEATILTGSGACAPIFGPDKKHIYVCNQFQNTVSEIDPISRTDRKSVV